MGSFIYYLLLLCCPDIVGISYPHLKKKDVTNHKVTFATTKTLSKHKLTCHFILTEKSAFARKKINVVLQGFTKEPERLSSVRILNGTARSV